ncbi:hypothetical protein TYRP_015052, partial [Tyrophagus putrescentiae]
VAAEEGRRAAGRPSCTTLAAASRRSPSTVRNLQVLQQLLRRKNYRKAASFISTYSSDHHPRADGRLHAEGPAWEGRRRRPGQPHRGGHRLVGEVVISLCWRRTTSSPLVAAKLHLVWPPSAWASTSALPSTRLHLQGAVRAEGRLRQGQGGGGGPGDCRPAERDQRRHHQLEAMKTICWECSRLKEAKNFDLLLEQVQSKVEEANEVYLSTSKKIGELNVKLNELKATMACSKESSETTAKVSYGVSALSCAASAGALLVPGLNLVVAGTLVAGSIAALGTCAVGAYLSLSFQSLIRKVAELQGEVDARRGEMDLIKGRIDGMLKRAQLLKDEHLKEADPEAYVSDSELADFEEDGE